jgi:hypothetical protein
MLNSDLLSRAIHTLRSFLYPGELYPNRPFHSTRRVLRAPITNLTLLDMCDRILKWKFIYVNHMFCGKSDNTFSYGVHFVGPSSLARWPTMSQVSERWSVRILLIISAWDSLCGGNWFLYKVPQVVLIKFSICSVVIKKTLQIQLTSTLHYNLQQVQLRLLVNQKGICLFQLK